MKYLLFVIFICLCSPDLFAQIQDSVKVETLPEVILSDIIMSRMSQWIMVSII